MTEPVTLEEHRLATLLPRWKRLSERIYPDGTTATYGHTTTRYLSHRENTLTDDEKREYVRKIFFIPGTLSSTYDGEVAIWNGIHMETIKLTSGYRAGIGYFAFLQYIANERYNPSFHPEEHPATILYPIDPRLTKKDIVGATNFYPNADNTGWLFSHCDSDYHKDFEYNLTSALNSVFAREKDLAHDGAHSATYSVFLRNNSETRHTMGEKTRVLDALRDFHADVELEVLKEHKAKYIGYYHQNPNESHIHELLARAFRKVMAAWEADNDILAKWLSIKEATRRMLNRITIHYPYAYRWNIPVEE